MHDTQCWQQSRFGMSFISCICVGCCGMHNILFSQQLEVVGELVQVGEGEKAIGCTIFWAADSCMRVRLCGSLGNGEWESLAFEMQ